jgi:hypothetical protein
LAVSGYSLIRHGLFRNVQNVTGGSGCWASALLGRTGNRLDGLGQIAPIMLIFLAAFAIAARATFQYQRLMKTRTAPEEHPKPSTSRRGDS